MIINHLENKQRRRTSCDEAVEADDYLAEEVAADNVAVEELHSDRVGLLQVAHIAIITTASSARTTKRRSGDEEQGISASNGEKETGASSQTEQSIWVISQNKG